MREVKLKIKAKDNTRRAFLNINNNLKTMEKRVGGAHAAIGALVSVGGIGLLIKKTLEVNDEIAKTSTRLGISTEALSQYKHVADISGVSFQQLSNGMKKLQKSASDAGVGLSTPKRAFEELNINVEEFKRLAPEEQFEVFADALAKVPLQSDKTRLAMDVMGRAGSDLITVMNGGSSAIKEMRKEADLLGLTLTEEDARNFEKVNDSFTRMQALSTGLAKDLTVQLIPAMQAFNDTVVDIRTDSQALPDWLKQTAFFASEAALEFQDLGDLLGAYAAVVDRVVNLDFEGAARIFELRGATRRDLEEDLVNFRTFLEEKVRIEEEVNSSGSNTDNIDENPNFITGLTKDEMEAQLAEILWFHNRSREIDILEADNKKKLADDVSNYTMATQQNILNQGIGLLRILGRENKNYAIAAIAIEKGLAIAEASMNTSVAYTKALTIDPLGRLSARVATLGAIQIGLIAATGLAQASQISSGGGSLGSSSNPVSTSSETPISSLSSTSGVPQSNKQIQVFFNGLTYDQAFEDFKTKISEGDEILISEDSRQFNELVEASSR